MLRYLLLAAGAEYSQAVMIFEPIESSSTTNDEAENNKNNKIRILLYKKRIKTIILIISL